MKRLILPLLCLFLVSYVSSAKIIEVPEAVARMSVMTAGGGVPAGGGVAYDWTETFDSAGYDETWSESGTAVDEDYTTSPAPLEGTQSLELDSTSGTVYARTEWTEADAVYFYFLLRPTAVEGDGDIALILDQSSNTRCYLKYIDGSPDRFLLGEAKTWGETTDATISVSTSSTYSVWYEFVKGSGSDGSCTVYVATDSTTKPGSPLIQHTGITFEVGDTAGRLELRGVVGGDSIFDQVIRHSSAIGSSP